MNITQNIIVKISGLLLFAVISSFVAYAQNNYNYVKTYIAKRPIGSEIKTQDDRDIVAEAYQYHDGLGRPIQTISIETAPSSYDLVSFKIYDGFGRADIQYLPFTASTNGFLQKDAIAAQENFYNASTTHASDTHPFAKSVFEYSPHNRILEQGAPGASWQPGGATIKYNYELSANTDLVMRWTLNANTNLPETLKRYGNGELIKNVTTDEEGHRVMGFITKLGKTVLKRMQSHENGANTEEWADTYYIYDDYNNLRYVLPPQMISEISTIPFTPSTEQLNNWAFQYHYDGRKRMVKKKVPGTGKVTLPDSGSVYMIYDDRDRLVMTQDGNQRMNNEWIFTKYDRLNRPVITGIYLHDKSMQQVEMQAYVDGIVAQGSNQWYETFDNSTSMHGYDNLSFPNTNRDNSALNILTVTYYDNYLFVDTQFGAGYQYVKASNDCTALNGESYCYESEEHFYIKDQITGSKTRILGSSNFLKSVNYYDKRYRVIQARSSNQQNTIDVLSNQYDFVGQLLESRLSHSDKVIIRNYEYDRAGRLKKGFHELIVNGESQGKVLLAENKYNELGEVIEKNLHVENGTPFQSVDYRYNIRGWLESINNAQLLSGTNNDDTNQPKDFFGMELIYNSTLNGVPTGN